jgi:hypothetical protein
VTSEPARKVATDASEINETVSARKIPLPSPLCPRPPLKTRYFEPSIWLVSGRMTAIRHGASAMDAMDWFAVACVLIAAAIYFAVFAVIGRLFRIAWSYRILMAGAISCAVVVVLSKFLIQDVNVRVDSLHIDRDIRLSPLPLPTRIFAGPHQYPPQNFAAYGIVAFAATATKDDRRRYMNICEGYVSTLVAYNAIPAPLNQQMVTVWPVDSDDLAISGHVYKKPANDACDEAVDHYGLVTAQTAIRDARNDNATLDGLGPFLLAWSPSLTKGQPGALVLVTDMSNVTTTEEAKQVFVQWGLDIEENPELWEKGWNLTKLKLIIRLWANKYGGQLLQLAGGKS